MIFAGCQRFIIDYTVEPQLILRYDYARDEWEQKAAWGRSGGPAALYARHADQRARLRHLFQRP
jgi:hypothetical protein